MIKTLLMVCLILVLPLFAKEVYIIHGFNCTSQYAWIPSVKKELQNLGYMVKTPNMPTPDKPSLEQWIKHLKEQISSLNSETYFITHSLGGIALLQFLSQEHFKNHSKIGGVILVSPFDKPLEILPILDDFTRTKPDYKNLQKHIHSAIIISSKDDKIVPHSLSKEVAKALNAKLVATENGGHFMDQDGFYTFPLVVEIFKNLQNKQINK
ncbi:alpha/beta hydrolase [uncultured Helicobacter sp.]|uniref:RBBP9/YdeN family alpha/beta hydrolase n=1 Tax=uncultured Helicobacter sp. TaxID=175537 RepID=UPI0026302CCA|nr:alpha/beta hydrolase [uncultured Helicobacter sp.]